MGSGSNLNFRSFIHPGPNFRRSYWLIPLQFSTTSSSNDPSQPRCSSQPSLPIFSQSIRWRADRVLQPTTTERIPPEVIFWTEFSLRDINFLQLMRYPRPESMMREQKLKVRSVSEEQHDEITRRPLLPN